MLGASDRSVFYCAAVLHANAFSSLCGCKNTRSHKSRSDGTAACLLWTAVLGGFFHTVSYFATCSQKFGTKLGNMFPRAQVVLFNCEPQGCSLCFLSDSHYSGIRWDGGSVTTLHQPCRMLHIFLYQMISLSARQSDPLRTSGRLWSRSRFTSAFARNSLLSRRTWKAKCPLKRSKALVVCSNFKELMFMFTTPTQQEVLWHPGVKVMQVFVADSQDCGFNT